MGEQGILMGDPSPFWELLIDLTNEDDEARKEHKETP